MYLPQSNNPRNKKSVSRLWKTHKMLWVRTLAKQIILTAYAWHLLSVSTTQRAIDSLQVWEA